jgi:V/A-type H+-transporting ATPase subunit K
MIKKFLVSGVTMLQASALLALGIMLGATCIYSSIRQAQVCANGINATAQGHNVTAATMVMAVFPELYAILALLVVILASVAL